MYVPEGIGHAVLNLDAIVSVTENFLSVNSLDALADYRAFGQDPLDSDHTPASVERLWRNLMARDLTDVGRRRFARLMLEQIREATRGSTT